MFAILLRTVVGAVLLLIAVYLAATVVGILRSEGPNPTADTQLGTVRMEHGVSYEQFQRVEMGMTLAQVAAIFGAYGMNTSTQQGGLAGVVPNPDMVDYSWPGDQPLARVLISFRQGKVSEKLQMGIPTPPPYPLTVPFRPPGETAAQRLLRNVTVTNR